MEFLGVLGVLMYILVLVALRCLCRFWMLMLDV